MCPFCHSEQTRVTNKRASVLDVRPQLHAIWRRRECLKCQRRFTTYEVEKLDLYSLRKRPPSPAAPK